MTSIVSVLIMCDISRYFHEQSQNIKIIPILVATDAVDFSNIFEQYDDGVLNL